MQAGRSGSRASLLLFANPAWTGFDPITYTHIFSVAMGPPPPRRPGCCFCHLP